MSINNKEYGKVLLDKIENADAVLVGAAAGMSASCGYNYFYENDEYFKKYLNDYHEKYGFTGSFNGYYYPFPTHAHRWAFLARVGCMAYECEAKQPYYDLMDLIKDKDYHIMTTNQDFLFTYVAPEEKISAIQGDFRYYQCAHACTDKLYPNKELVYEMNTAIDKDLKIPEELIPRCPECGSMMEPWVRGPEFLEGSKYRDEYRKINEFIAANKEKDLLLLELGVGQMTPMFIREPFWNLTYNLPNTSYVAINPKDAIVHPKIENKSVAIKEDIAKVLSEANELKKMEKVG